MHPSTALATVLVDELIRGGVQEAVLAPGSRSAPLAYALEEADRARRLRLHVRVDERTAGFLALGMARASRRPVPVVTTSGTAVANLHPAVLEAHHSGIPLVVLAADRPAELRGTGANQTTVQPGIFAGAVRWEVDLPAPESVSSVANAFWRSSVCRAVSAALGPPARSEGGPVLLNVSFRDPLAPDLSSQTSAPAGREEGRSWTETGPDTTGEGSGAAEVASRVASQPGAAGPTSWAAVGTSPVAAGERTVVLLGDLPDPSLSRQTLAWAAQAGWPVLAEPFGALPVGETVVPHPVLVARQVAAEPAAAAVGPAADRPPSLLPDRVVVVGRLTLFREFGALLRRPEVLVEHVTATAAWSDPSHVVHRVHGVGALEVVPNRSAAAQEWVDAWLAAGRSRTSAVREVTHGLTGPGVAATVASALTSADVLVLGSSNAPRDLALALDGSGAAATVIANRGLAGIDGTVSTAVGVALAISGPGERCGPDGASGVSGPGERCGPDGASGVSGPGERCAPERRVVALMGDLTFLHDLNGLLIGPGEPHPRLTIVVANDDGGGIFSTLEYGDPARSATPAAVAATERIFGTPHGTDLAALCAAHRVDHVRVAAVEELADLLRLPARGVRVIEAPIDRSGHRRLRDQLG